MRENNRRSILWGAGSQARRVMQYMKIADEIDFVVDNDIRKQRSVFYGKEIKHPSEITKWKDYLILIPDSYYNAVSTQLRKMGLIENDDFKKLDVIIPLDRAAFLRDIDESRDRLIRIADKLDITRKKIVFIANHTYYDKNYNHDFLMNFIKNDKADVVLVSEGDKDYSGEILHNQHVFLTEAPLCVSKRFYLEKIEKSYEEAERYVEGKGLHKYVIQHLEAEKLDYNTSLFWTYHIAQYFEEIITILGPDIIICANSVDPAHGICDSIGKEYGIRMVFTHTGIIPGTMSFDVYGEVGESRPALYPEHFNELEVDEAEKAYANEVIVFLCKSQLNRHYQSENDIECLLERINRTKKTVFFAGQNDVCSHMIPYTESTRMFHSPIFKSTWEAARYLANVCERNDWNFIFKPHPMFIDREEMNKMPDNVIIFEGANINDLIDVSDVTATILSSVNYLAMIRNKPVVMLGYTQSKGKGITYEAFEEEVIESQINDALTRGFDSVQHKAFIRHLAACLKYYVYDDNKDREIRYGKRPPACIDDLFELDRRLSL